MEIREFNKEFVERTKQIILDSDKSNYRYEVTLLLNCMLGLIGLPTVKTRSYREPFAEECVLELKRLNVIKMETNDSKTFRTIKNALSHMYIEPVNQDGRINNIILRDKDDAQSPFHTELCFTVQQLKEFSIFVADKHLERIADGADAIGRMKR